MSQPGETAIQLPAIAVELGGLIRQIAHTFLRDKQLSES